MSYIQDDDIHGIILEDRNKIEIRLYAKISIWTLFFEQLNFVSKYCEIFFEEW